MPNIDLIREFLTANSFGAILLRALIWFVVALIIIASTDGSGRQNAADLKSNLGFLILFLILASSLVYLLFGFVPLLA